MNHATLSGQHSRLELITLIAYWKVTYVRAGIIGLKVQQILCYL